MTQEALPPKDREVFGVLQEFNRPQPVSPDWAIYNTVSIPAPEIPGTIFLSRAVDKGNIKEGVPDMNSLHVCIIDPNGNFKKLEDLKLPINGKMVNWEDPRAGANGRTLGFTVVIREGDKYNPHPALVRVKIKDGNLKVAGTPEIFENLTGKNVIPIENGIIYRPDGVSHQLHYFDYQGGLLRIIDFSNFKNIDWLSEKMGVAARPMELEGGLKLLFIHGVRKGMGIDGKIKDDIYAIGIAILDERWQVKAVDKEPLLKRIYFLGNLQPSEDLRPEKKEVVYLCDFIETKNGLILPVNVGDRITVLTRLPYSALRTRIKNLLSG